MTIMKQHDQLTSQFYSDVFAMKRPRHLRISQANGLSKEVHDMRYFSQRSSPTIGQNYFQRDSWQRSPRFYRMQSKPR